jgi:gas vesicle protein
MAENGGMFKGALIGGLIGAAAALLMAPKSGRELRADLSDRYTDVSDRTKKVLADVSIKTQEVAQTVGSKTSEVARTMSDHATGIMDKTRSAVSAAKDEVSSWKEEKAIANGAVKEDTKFN